MSAESIVIVILSLLVVAFIFVDNVMIRMNIKKDKKKWKEKEK